MALVLGLTVAGFVVARALGHRDAHGDSVHRADVAAAQIRERVAQGSSLSESLRLFMARGGAGVTSTGFAANSSQWLSPAGFPGAAWVEQVRASLRPAYERRVGHAILTENREGRLVRAGSRPSYLPATLVSGIAPMVAPGIDLGSEPRMGAAVARASRLYDAGATPLVTRPDRTEGLFLVKFAPRLDRGIVEPGFVVVFVPELALRAAVTAAPEMQLVVGGASTAGRLHGAVIHKTFTEAGQRFDVIVPEQSTHGAAAALPWIILGAGLVFAGLAAALGVNAARRARAQDELDRIFNLSPDFIAVADFEGHFKRVNPAAEQILGYTRDELLSKPYLDFVHPDDRATTTTEAHEIAGGKTTLSFENRYVCKDGSFRVLEWTSTPVVDDAVMYGVARDVTERRQAEGELARLADEQAALRRVATLVAQGAPAGSVFDAVAAEMVQFLEADGVTLSRYEPDDEFTVVAHRGSDPRRVPSGTRVSHRGDNMPSRVRRTMRSARMEHRSDTYGRLAEAVGDAPVRVSVGAPIVVEGRLWGVAIANWRGEDRPPADTEERMAKFAELLDTAIANADSRDQLTASRARLLTEADEARRRVVRDLHDGAQQRVVHTILTLKLAQQALEGGGDGDPKLLVGEALEQAEETKTELRELAHGILPSDLTLGGLQAGVEAVVARLDVPVGLDVPAERFAPEIEASAYFIVAEALTNIVKHAHATHADVRAALDGGLLQVEIRDDGVGGADPAGHGLTGMNDRVIALGGRLEVHSPVGGGTVLVATLPVPGQ